MKLLLVADYRDWILGQLARRLAQRLKGVIHTTVLYEEDPGFRRQFFSLIPRHDGVHLLSPWHFYQLGWEMTCPCVATVHHMVDWQVFVPHASRADGVCVVSRQWEQPTRDHLPRHVPVWRMPYGIDHHRFAACPASRQMFRQQHGIDQRTLLLGFAGKASSNEGSRKGIDRLWACLETLAQQSNLRCKLVMAGKDWSRDMVPSTLRQHVLLLPFMQQDQLPAYFAALDYYLCTSRIEGVPHPVLEAMASEAVVLATPVGVVPEIMTSGHNGFVLSHDQPERDCLAAITRTAANPGMRRQIGQQARRTVQQHFDWQQVDAHDYLRFYQAACAHHRRGRFRRQLVRWMGLKS